MQQYTPIPIAGTIVTYNPDWKALFKNIHSYDKMVNALYIVDNSPTRTFQEKDLERENFNCEIQYLPQSKNIGVAAALNIGCSMALSNGFNWILTMDQDSSFMDSSIVEGLKENQNKRLGIIAPKYSSLKINENLSSRVHSMSHVITSGNLVSLTAWADVGKFDEKLFIDEVDTDFCFRLKLKNYTILLLEDVILNHSIGTQKKVFYIYKFRTLELHPPQRLYYLFRNTFYLEEKYKKYFPEVVRSRKRHIFKRLKHHLFSSMNGYLAVYFALLGYFHYKKNKFGPL